ncbi:MAG TPA: hypothetical protein VGR35_16155 [Tepidisphaeraceae bacterium]|nr:hypothetical protein [Tepidisphaeraceae bacterium]
MPRADKKQRHNAKRKAKQLEMRRRASVSPLKRLAASKGAVEGWISEDFEGLGQLQMFVFKQGAGMSGVGCFLVDRGVVGLKDAWARMIDREAFSGMLDASRRRGISMRRATIDEIRRWVAGGLRWAHENGMCLPKDWAKPASLINGVGDWASADVSAFAREFTGHPEDLRQRLIGEPFETYLRRTDITFFFSDDAPYLDQETGEYVDADDESDFYELDEEDGDLESIAANLPAGELNRLGSKFTPAAMVLAQATADWLAARGDTPSSELVDAWRSMMLATMLTKSAMPDDSEDDVADFSYDLLEDMVRGADESRRRELHRAVGQMLEHLQTDPMMMQKTVLKIGFADEPDEVDEQS